MDMKIFVDTDDDVRLARRSKLFLTSPIKFSKNLNNFSYLFLHKYSLQRHKRKRPSTRKHHSQIS